MSAFNKMMLDDAIEQLEKNIQLSRLKLKNTIIGEKDFYDVLSRVSEVIGHLNHVRQVNIPEIKKYIEELQK